MLFDCCWYSIVRILSTLITNEKLQWAIGSGLDQIYAESTCSIFSCIHTVHIFNCIIQRLMECQTYSLFLVDLLALIKCIFCCTYFNKYVFEHVQRSLCTTSIREFLSLTKSDTRQTLRKATKLSCKHDCQTHVSLSLSSRWRSS